MGHLAQQIFSNGSVNASNNKTLPNSTNYTAVISNMITQLVTRYVRIDIWKIILPSTIERLVSECNVLDNAIL